MAASFFKRHVGNIKQEHTGLVVYWPNAKPLSYTAILNYSPVTRKSGHLLSSINEESVKSIFLNWPGSWCKT